MPRKARAATAKIGSLGGAMARGKIDKKTKSKFKKEQPFSVQGRAAQLKGINARNRRILDELDKM